MSKICKRELEIQKYWKDFDKHQFFKVMMNDYRLRLRIPDKFVLNLSDKLLGDKILRGPSGNSWTVEVKRREDGYFFCNGWQVFVDDHCLEDTDLLVFQMNKCNSCFDVMVFDSSACEKEDTFFVKKQEKSEDDGEPSKGKSKSVDANIVESFSSEEDSLESVKDAKRKAKSVSNCIVEESRKRKYTTCKKKNIEPAESDRRKVHQLAIKHKSCVPCVLMTMKPTHVYRGQLKLPKKWVEKYMRKQSEKIKVRIPGSGKTWAAEVRWRQEGLVIQTGWANFVMDNDVGEHDICVIELAQGGKHNLMPLILDVYIYPSSSSSSLPQ